MPKSKRKIPEEFKKIEEIQDFWDTYSTSDYWDKMDDVNMELSPTLQSKLELKKLYRLLDFSPKEIAELEAKAKTENINTKQLIRKLIIEHV